MRASLTIVKGKHRGERYVIDTPGVYVLGRSRENAIRIPDGSVSRRHSQLQFDGQYFWLSDCDSVNGTRVNKRKITKYLLQNGDMIKIGRTKLQFGLEPDASV